VPVAALVPLAAFAWWVVGYFPWLAAGLGRSASASSRVGGSGLGGERLAVPLTSSSMSLLVLGALVGGVVAGMLGLVARPSRRGRAAMATLTGVGVAVMVAGGQAALAAHVGSPEEFSADPRVLAGLCVVLGLTALVGWAYGACATLDGPGAGIALAVLAGATPAWLFSSLTSLTELFGTSPIGQLGTLGTTTVWLGGAVLAVALAVIGVRPPHRLIWWPVAVLVAWAVSPVLTAVAYLEQLIRPGTGFPRFLGDTIPATVLVLKSAAALGARPLAPWVAATAIGAVLALTVPRLRPRPTTPPSALEHGRQARVDGILLWIFLWILTVGGALAVVTGVAFAVYANSPANRSGNDLYGVAVLMGVGVAVLGGLVFLSGVAGLLVRLRRSRRQD
jgi:hypothetical protein